MKITVSGKNKKEVELLKKRISSFKGFCNISEKNPDIVITFGGDGSLLYGERKYPGVPKLMLRNKSICKKCNRGVLRVLLMKLFNKKYKIQEYHKIEARVKGRKKIGVNEIIIRNSEQFHALRFNVFVNNKKVNEDIIGDGIVVCTPYGSSGYFHSITRKSFKKGIGIAFNNSIKKIAPIILRDSVVKLKVLRNSGVVSVDNDPRVIKIKEKDVVIIKQSKERFKIIRI